MPRNARGVSWAFIVGTVFTVLCAVRPVRAQVLYGSLVGNVTDPTGAAVPGAKVAVTQVGMGFKRDTTTDSSGVYNFPTVPAGNYSVEVSKQGFKTYTKSDVPVSLNTVSRVDVTLEVGSVSQSVEVMSTAPLLTTDRADVHHDLSAVAIQNIPMPPGNNFEDLFRAIPGFNPPESAHSIPTNPSRSLSYNVNGTSNLTNDVRIDGVSQFNIWVPENTAYVPSADSIEVVNVATGNFNTDQGLTGGSVVNVQTRSGTNSIHGDAYEFHYDNALEGLPFFAPGQGITRIPKDVFNQFGASVGGPIKKNKLFWFANVDATRQAQYSTRLATVPTMVERTGDLRGLDLLKPNPNIIYDPATGNADGTGRTPISCNGVPNVICANRLSPAAQKLLSLLPPPNLPSSNSTTPSNNFLAAADFAFNRFTSDDKIDWNATDKLHMFGHLGLLTYSDFNPQMFDFGSFNAGGDAVNQFGGTSNEGRGSGHTTSVTVNQSYVLRPSIVLDGNFGFTRMVTNSAMVDLNHNWGRELLGIPGTNGTRPFEGSWPKFAIGGFSDMGTHNGFMPYFRNDPQFNWSANANWIRQSHNVRFGVMAIDQHLNHQQPEWGSGGTTQPAAGGFSFGSGPTQCKGCVSKGKTTSSNSYNNFATFLLGLDTNFGRNIQVPDFFHTITHEYGLYVNDQWQVRRNLTATLGLRWEYFPMPGRENRGLERFDFANNAMMLCGTGGIPRDCGTSVGKKYFAPRIGLAYRATNTMVIRAAYGITWDPFNVVDDLRTNYPVLLPFDVNQPNTLAAAGVLDTLSLQNSLPALNLPVGISPSPVIPSPGSNGEVPLQPNVGLVTTGNRLQRGYIQSWNFTVEKQLPSGWVAQAGYVATRTVNQLGQLELNVTDPTIPAGCIAETSCGGNPSLPFNTPAFGNRLASTTFITPVTNNHYDSLQVRVNHRFAQAYMVQFGYTWSKTIGMAGVNGQKDGPEIPNRRFYNLNRGLANIDRPQNFSAMFVAEAPFGSGKRWATGGIASKLMGGWQASGLLTAVSGRVFRISADGGSLNASGNTQRPDRLMSHVPIIGAVGPGSTWFFPGAFAGVTASPLSDNDQRFGTSPFFPLHGPNSFNFDAALFRNIKLTERWNIQFRAQAINVTNTAHFRTPNGSCGSYGTSSTPGAAVPTCSNGSFGQVSSTWVSEGGRDGIDQRQFVLSLKLIF